MANAGVYCLVLGGLFGAAAFITWVVMPLATDNSKKVRFANDAAFAIGIMAAVLLGAGVALVWG